MAPEEVVSKKVQSALDEIQAAMDQLKNTPLDGSSAEELIKWLDGLGEAAEIARDVQLRLIGRMHRSSLPVAFGGTPTATVLAERWRISSSEAHERVVEAMRRGY